MSASEPILARIKPFDPRRGTLTKTYTVAGRRFVVSDGWVEVDSTLARVLHKCTADGETHGSKVFDVLYQSKAIALEKKEELERQRALARRADSPHRIGSARTPKGSHGAMTTADLAALDEVEVDDFEAAINGGNARDPDAEEFSSPDDDDEIDLNAPKVHYGEQTDPDLADVPPAPAAPVVPGAPGSPAPRAQAKARKR